MAGSRLELRSGAAVRVDLGLPSGREAGFARPVVIVTAQEALDQGPSVVQVVPVTSTVLGQVSAVELRQMREILGLLSDTPPP